MLSRAGCSASQRASTAAPAAANASVDSPRTLRCHLASAAGGRGEYGRHGSQTGAGREGSWGSPRQAVTEVTLSVDGRLCGTCRRCFAQQPQNGQRQPRAHYIATACQISPMRCQYSRAVSSQSGKARGRRYRAMQKPTKTVTVHRASTGPLFLLTVEPGILPAQRSDPCSGSDLDDHQMETQAHADSAKDADGLQLPSKPVFRSAQVSAAVPSLQQIVLRVLASWCRRVRP